MRLDMTREDFLSGFRLESIANEKEFLAANFMTGSAVMPPSKLFHPACNFINSATSLALYSSKIVASLTTPKG